MPFDHGAVETTAFWLRSRAVEHKHCHRDNHTPLYGLELHIADALGLTPKDGDQG